MSVRKREKMDKAIGIFVFATLVASAAYALLGLVASSGGPRLLPTGGSGRGAYLLMLVECVLGILVMFLPSMLERRFRVAIPGRMYALFVVFLYAAIYLGEIRSFYYRIPHWDLILHAFSGLMLGALGFSVVSLLNDSERVAVSLSPLFLSIFAFSFALSLGVLWEFYEFAVDGLLGLNMQRFAAPGGAALAGRAALADTMEDLLVDALAALAVSVFGFLSMKAERGWLSRLSIRREPGEGEGRA